jgi:hypothetical protein
LKKLTQKLFVIQILLLLLTPKINAAQDIPDVVTSTIKLIQSNDFENIASRYLFPTSYSESQLAEERKYIKDALKILFTEYGRVTEIKINQDDTRWLNLEVLAGDADFMKNHPQFTQYVFKTNFSVRGKGFIVINVYENNGNPKLKSVGYALADTPQNMDILLPISKKLMDLLLKQQKVEKT